MDVEGIVIVTFLGDSEVAGSILLKGRVFSEGILTPGKPKK